MEVQRKEIERFFIWLLVVNLMVFIARHYRLNHRAMQLATAITRNNPVHRRPKLIVPISKPSQKSASEWSKDAQMTIAHRTINGNIAIQP